eukprot:9353855-Ditylum_brightwellii.AAC.1
MSLGVSRAPLRSSESQRQIMMLLQINFQVEKEVMFLFNYNWAEDSLEPAGHSSHWSYHYWLYWCGLKRLSPGTVGQL